MVQRHRAGSPGFVERPRLLAMLDGALAGRVAVVSAPAGSGKSVLLHQWAERHQSTGAIVARIAIDPNDRDPWSLWPATGRAIAVRAGSTVPDGDRAIEWIHRTMASYDRPLTLVIDDLHELAPERARTQLEQFIARMPAGVHLVLAGRNDLGLGLHRLRLTGELTEVRGEDLEFTHDEAEGLMAAAGVALSPGNAATLLSRTEGWAAGLALAAGFLRDRDDHDRSVDEFSGGDRIVAEYLLAEVIGAQPDEVRTLLRRTSVVDRVNGSLADDLMQRAGTEALLHHLERTTGFVVAVDPGRSWFRYRRLVSDLLRLELRQHEPESVGPLHRRASHWFEAHELFGEAVHHAQLAEDWRLAARQMADHSPALALDGRQDTVHSLLGRFPWAEVAGDTELAVVRAADQLSHGSLDEAGRLLRLADQHVPVAPERQRRHRLTATLLRMDLARRRFDLPGVLDLTTSLVEEIEHAGEDLPNIDDVRVVGLMNRGIAEVWAGRFDEAVRRLREGVRLARRRGRPSVEMACLAYLALAVYRVSFVEARRYASEAIELARTHGWLESPWLAPAFEVAAGVSAWLGDLDEGERQLRLGANGLRPDLEPGVAFLQHAITGLLAHGRGRPHDALAAYREAERVRLELVGTHPAYLSVLGLRVRVQVALGALANARHALGTLTVAERDAGEIRLAESVLLRAEGRPDEALRALTTVLDGSSPMAHRGPAVQAQMFTAGVLAELNRPVPARHAVEVALTLAQPEGLILPFLLTESRVLLEHHPRHTTAHGAFLDEIVDVLNGHGHANRANPELLEPLTGSETRVLGYLPSNLSTRDIGAVLYLSVNTVKVHMRRIYVKLDAHTRAEAVRRARGLGLVGPGPRH